MDQKSLIDALDECSNTCGWCVEHCPDEDKYEMLNTCINIQNKFSELGRIASIILAHSSITFMKSAFDFFEERVNELQQKHSTINHKKSERKTDEKEVWKLPGCSQIFSVAQSLRDIYVNNSLKYDSE